MEGNTALGASSPAKPAFTRPEPLSHTRAVVSSSSHILAGSVCKHIQISLSGWFVAHVAQKKIAKTVAFNHCKYTVISFTLIKSL